jgi:hypothetical protein
MQRSKYTKPFGILLLYKNLIFVLHMVVKNGKIPHKPVRSNSR